jgi:hypothetical protein
VKEDNFAVRNCGAEIAIFVERIEHKADFDFYLLLDGRLFDFEAGHTSLRDCDGILVDLDSQRKALRSEDRAILEGDFLIVRNGLVNWRLKIPHQLGVVRKAHEPLEAVAGLVRNYCDLPSVINDKGQLGASIRGAARHRDAAWDGFENVPLPEVDHFIVREYMVYGAVIVALEGNVCGGTSLIKNVPRNHLVAGHRIEGIVEDDGLFRRWMPGILWVGVREIHMNVPHLGLLPPIYAGKNAYGGGNHQMQS